MKMTKKQANTQACKDIRVQTFVELKRIAENSGWWRDMVR